MPGFRVRPRRLAAVALPALLAAAPALADDATVDELVVTAQLREQAAKEVPFALTAYSGEDLVKLRVQDFAELSQFTPGLVVQNQSPNTPGFVLRGVTSDSGEATYEPRVSVFQDGVSISKARGSFIELFDVARVEVAKGPQSTLYGRGALIGGVNVIQNKADPRAYGVAATAEAGNNGYWLAEGMVNAPLSDTAAIRLSGRIKQRDGTVENLAGGEDFNSVDTWAVRGAFNWNPSQALRIDVIANYQKDSPSGTSFKSGSFRPTDPVTGAVIGTTRPQDGAYLTGAPGVAGGKALGIDRDVWGVTGLVRYLISPSVTLNSISAYRTFDALEVFDVDGVSLPIFTAAEDARGKQWSQEFRLNVEPEGSAFSGFVGVSYFRETGSQAASAQFDERAILARLAGALNGGPLQPGRPATDPAPGAVFGQTAFTAALLQGVAAAAGTALSPAQAAAIAANLKSGHMERGTNRGETEAVDVFADLTFKATERLELSLGARYSHDDKTTGFSSAVLNGRSVLGAFLGALSQPAPVRTALLGALAVPGAANIPTSALYPVPMFGLGTQPTPNGAYVDADLKKGGFSWRATARYAASEDVNLYANYGRGRRPAVLSARPPAAPGTSPIFNTLPAETVDSFEVGAKAALADRRLVLEGAVFHYRYKNFQTLEQIGTTFVVSNAGKARATGFEGQARYAAGENVDLFATYAYNHGRFRTGAREGNHFRLSPDHSLSAGADFRIPVLDGELSVRPTFSWRSKVYFDDDNDLPALQQRPQALVPDNLQDEAQKSYGLANLQVAYRPGEGPWTFGAFVTNLFDKTYIKDAGNTGDTVGLATFIAGEPRFFGVSVSYRR